MRKLIIPTSFKVGECYSNDQIHYALEIGNSGGIRPKLNSLKELDFVVLTTSVEENKIKLRNPYADKIEGNILIYTGSGLKGEQDISGVNKRLLEQRTNPIPILGFTKENSNIYKYMGFLYLLRYYQDYQLDNVGLMRKVLIFEFQIISTPQIIKVEGFKNHFNQLYNEIKSKTTNDDYAIEQLSNIKNVDNEKEISRLKDLEIFKTKLMTINPYAFEFFASKLISHVGFLDVKVTKKSGDDGVDVSAILTNTLSLNLKYAFQVKRWKHSVGRNEVANLRGSMDLNNQGVIISTSYFTKSAVSEANSNNKTPINLVGVDKLYDVIKLSKFDIDQNLDKSFQ